MFEEGEVCCLESLRNLGDVVLTRLVGMIKQLINMLQISVSIEANTLAMCLKLNIHRNRRLIPTKSENRSAVGILNLEKKTVFFSAGWEKAEWGS